MKVRELVRRLTLEGIDQDADVLLGTAVFGIYHRADAVSEHPRDGAVVIEGGLWTEDDKARSAEERGLVSGPFTNGVNQ